MSEKLFKIDCNLDGYYSDTNNTIQSVENFIQVVNGMDGSALVEPDINGVVVSISAATDLTDVVSISGRGVVYDNSGSIVGEKGGLIIRDGLGNSFSFKNFQASSIKEEDDGSLFMRDASIAKYLINEETFVGLDSIINNASKSVVSPGTGSLVQVSRKDSVGKSSVSVDTVNLSEKNIVVVSGKVIANKETIFDLVDIYPGNEVILSTVYFTPRREGYSKPVYLNWTGSLDFYTLTEDDFDYYEEVVCGESITKSDEERVTLYSSYYKRHFIPSNTSTNMFLVRTHRLTLRSRDASVFEHGDLNVIVFDGSPTSTVRQGYVDLDNEDKTNITFDDFTDSEYSVSIATSEFVESWYSNRKTNGFTANLERKFTGRVYWTAVHNALKDVTYA